VIVKSEETVKSKGGFIFVDGAEKNLVYLYDLRGKLLGSRSFAKDKDFDDEVLEAARSPLHVYQFEPEPGKLITFLAPEGTKPDEEILETAQKILEKHNIDIEFYHRMLHESFGFPTLSIYKQPVQRHITLPTIEALVLRGPSVEMEEETNIDTRRNLENVLYTIERELELTAAQIDMLQKKLEVFKEEETEFEEAKEILEFKIHAYHGLKRIFRSYLNRFNLLLIQEKLQSEGDFDRLEEIQNLLRAIKPVSKLMRFFEEKEIDRNKPDELIEMLRNLSQE